MAAPALGMVRPCASLLLPSGAEGMRAVAAAPGMAKTARTLPTRSVTAMVAEAPRPRASAAARAMMVPTSALDRLSAAGTAKSWPTEGGVGLGVGVTPPVPPPPPPLPPELPPPPPQEASTSALAAIQKVAIPPHAYCSLPMAVVADFRAVRKSAGR